MAARKAAREAEEARLPNEVAVCVDAYAKTLGIKTRSEAARSLLLLGLSTHYEAERKRAAAQRSKGPHGEADADHEVTKKMDWYVQ